MQRRRRNGVYEWPLNGTLVYRGSRLSPRARHISELEATNCLRFLAMHYERSYTLFVVHSP